MAEAGVLAYPVVLMSMYGVARVGRRQRWEALEWLRMGALASLFGMLIAVQVKLVMIGVNSQPITIASAAVGIVGMAIMLGSYLWERWEQHRLDQLPRLSAVLRA